MKTERTERKCPLCGKTYTDIPALSRADNVTLICPDCGTRQALQDFGVWGEDADRILGLIHNAKTEK